MSEVVCTCLHVAVAVRAVPSERCPHMLHAAVSCAVLGDSCCSVQSVCSYVLFLYLIALGNLLL